MLLNLLISILIIALCVALLSVGIIFGKRTELDMHIETNEAMKCRGIHCAKSLDGEMRRPNPHKIKEHENKTF